MRHQDKKFNTMTLNYELEVSNYHGEQCVSD